MRFVPTKAERSGTTKTEWSQIALQCANQSSESMCGRSEYRGVFFWSAQSLRTALSLLWRNEVKSTYEMSVLPESTRSQGSRNVGFVYLPTVPYITSCPDELHSTHLASCSHYSNFVVPAGGSFRMAQTASPDKYFRFGSNHWFDRRIPDATATSQY